MTRRTTFVSIALALSVSSAANSAWAQDDAEADALSADESGTGMWVGAIDEAAAKDKLVPGKVAEGGTYLVKEGDSLWSIAGSQLGNSYEWPRLWSYNPEITNPHWIYPDTQLRLGAGGSGEAQQAVVAASTNMAGKSQKMRFNRLNSGDIYIGDEAFLDKSALGDAGSIVGSHNEKLMLNPTDWCYVRFNKKPVPPPGTELTVWNPIHDVDRAIGEKGKLVKIMGMVRLMDYDAKHDLGRARVIEAVEPVERGFRISLVPRRYRTVKLKPAVANLDATVIASTKPVIMIGANQLMFMDIGANKGVELGNRAFVMRNGDVWRDTLVGRPEYSGAYEPDAEFAKTYPDEVVAEGRVVDVQKDTATVLVTRASVEVGMGDRVKLLAGR